MLDIIIVNYNTGNLLRECVQSLAAAQAATPVIQNLIVVDNASSDDSLGQIDSLYPGLLLVKNTDNRGFGAACNQGAALGSAEFVLFLNPDTRVFADTLPLALSALQSPENQQIGIVGVPLLNDAGQVSISCSRLPRLRGFFFKALGLEAWAAKKSWSQPMREWAHDQTCIVEQVMGAFFLMPRTLFAQLQGFDERFFVYFEEVDVCARAAALGKHSLFFTGTKAYHQGCGTSERIKAHRLFYSLRSRLLYGAKHFAAAQAWALLPLTLLLEPAARALQLLLRRDSAGLKALLQGSFWLWKDAINWWPVWLALRRERRA